MIAIFKLSDPQLRRLGMCWFMVAMFLLSGKAWAAKIGLGAQIIDVTGFTVKGFLSNQRALEASLGWKEADSELTLILSSHYLFLFPNAIKLDNVHLTSYVGLGVKVPSHFYWSELRVPLGVSYYFNSASIEAFGAVVPGITLYPNTDLALTMVLGARYFM